MTWRILSAKLISRHIIGSDVARHVINRCLNPPRVLRKLPSYHVAKLYMLTTTTYILPLRVCNSNMHSSITCLQPQHICQARLSPRHRHALLTRLGLDGIL